MARLGDRGRSSLGALVVVAALATVLVTALGVFSRGAAVAPDLSQAPPDQNTPQVGTPAVPATLARRVGAVVPERPIAARLPSGTTVPIRPVSTRSDGSLAVPTDIRTAGWWRGGSRLGDPFGSTLLAAHIDSFTQGLGPYVELLSVHAGQQVVLTSATLKQTFTVRSLRLVPQGSLAGQRWIYSANGPHRLTLVTCAPPYDAARGGYQNLAIVTADAAGAPTGKAP